MREGFKLNGLGSTIYFNPNFDGIGFIANEDGSTGRPPFIGLAHELGHALNIASAQVDNTIQPTITDPDTGTPGVLDIEEIKVRTTTDNPIRKEQNVPLRAIPK